MIGQLQRILGITIFSVDNNIPGGLPFYLINGRTFNKIRIGEIPVLMINMSANEKFGAAALEREFP